jgi:hypothetical protein
MESEMSCRTWRREFRKWFEEAEAAGDPARIPPELAAHASGCRDCAARLRAAQRLLAPASEPAPEGLSDRVWARVSAASGRELAKRRAAAGSARSPRRRALRLLPAAAALAIAAAGGYLVAREERQVVTVRLSIDAPGAREVSVVGDWNGWSPEKNRLVDRGNGVWEGTVRLHRLREYRYQFLVDGERWVADPQAPLSIDDGFGGRSSVLQL